MATPVIMPRQGQSVESCILTDWYKKAGEEVLQGELLFAYETDKASFEEEAPADGILLACFYDSGDEVPVLHNVAVIGSKGEDAAPYRSGEIQQAIPDPEAPIKPGAGALPGAGDPEASRAQEPAAKKEIGMDSGNLAISPRARKLACEKRVILDGIVGTGPAGRIIERDIREALENGRRLSPLAQKKMEAEGLIPPKGSPDCGRYRTADLQERTLTQHRTVAEGSEKTGDYSDIPLSNMRKIIAAAMHRSLQNSAQLTHHMGANAASMLSLRKEVKARQKEGYQANITLNDMVCFAVIRSLELHPGANAHFLDDRVRQFQSVHLGLAVDTERGLMVPVLENAQRFSLAGLSEALKDLAEQARSGSISPDLILPEAASFTVSNLGNYGVEMFTPVINLPQVAILGVNTMVQRPAVLEDGTFGFLPFMGLSLTYDHRALDGGPATLFLAEIKKQIEAIGPALL